MTTDLFTAVSAATGFTAPPPPNDDPVNRTIDTLGGSTIKISRNGHESEGWDILVEFRSPNGAGMSGDVRPADLARALDGIVPGFTAAYVEPVNVPTGLGAVVEGRGGTQWVRVDEDEEPWRRVGDIYDDRTWLSDDAIAAELRNGGRVLSEGEQA